MSKRYYIRKGSIADYTIKIGKVLLIMAILCLMCITECPVCEHILCVCGK